MFELLNLKKSRAEAMESRKQVRPSAIPLGETTINCADCVTILQTARRRNKHGRAMMNGSGSQQWPRDEAGNDDGDDYSESGDGERSARDDDEGSSVQRDHSSVRSAGTGGESRRNRKSKRDSSSRASAEGGESYSSVEHPFQFSYTVEVAMLEIYNESVSSCRNDHFACAHILP